MLYFVVYLLVGVIALFMQATIHLMKAELSGYEAIEWWGKNEPFDMVWKSTDKFDFIVGLIVWPIRISYAQWVLIPSWYERYDRKNSTEET